MISLWAKLTESDVAAYASGLVLPGYLAHLALAPPRLAEQDECRTGEEPLRLTYRGEGRLEEYALAPDEHALGMILSVCLGLDRRRIHLPRDDARWHWDRDASPAVLRIYFAPAVAALGRSPCPAPSGEAGYVSVSRGHVFVARATCERYIAAWLARLGLTAEDVALTFDGASGGIEFDAPNVGGQLVIDHPAVADDLITFAGLRGPLDQIAPAVTLDRDPTSAAGGVFEDGVYFALTRADD